jgi:hypothetical protein
VYWRVIYGALLLFRADFLEATTGCLFLVMPQVAADLRFGVYLIIDVEQEAKQPFPPHHHHSIHATGGGLRGGRGNGDRENFITIDYDQRSVING